MVRFTGGVVQVESQRVLTMLKVTTFSKETWVEMLTSGVLEGGLLVVSSGWQSRRGTKTTHLASLVHPHKSLVNTKRARPRGKPEHKGLLGGGLELVDAPDDILGQILAGIGGAVADDDPHCEFFSFLSFSFFCFFGLILLSWVFFRCSCLVFGFTQREDRWARLVFAFVT